jgi:predicted DNA-binding transcriptional regulator YafY
MDKVLVSDKGFECRSVPLPDMSAELMYPRDIKVKALFDPDTKWRLVEEFGTDCCGETKDGKILFSADYSDMDNLVSWMLTFGDKVEVLEPQEVRERLKEIADNMSKKYGRKDNE